MRKTITASKKAHRRHFEDSAEAISAGTAEPLDLASDDIAIDSQVSGQLFARHLCPVCPRGAKVAAAGGKHNSGYSYCCKPRRTITSTIKKTLTKKRTLTVTKAPVSVWGLGLGI